MNFHPWFRWYLKFLDVFDAETPFAMKPNVVEKDPNLGRQTQVFQECGLAEQFLEATQEYP